MHARKEELFDGCRNPRRIANCESTSSWSFAFFHYGYSVSDTISSQVGYDIRVKRKVAGSKLDSPLASVRSVGRPPVPLHRFIAAALEIVDAEGAEALTMRSLAARVDSGTATLYRHFANRSELVAHVVDHVIGKVDLGHGELAASSWQVACRLYAHASYQTLSKHRRIAPLLVTHEPVGPQAMLQRERCIALLLAHGFPPPLAAKTYATLARYVLGFVMQLDDRPTRAKDRRLSARIAELEPSRFPASIAVAGSLPIPLDEEFAFGLELIVSGLSSLVGK